MVAFELAACDKAAIHEATLIGNSARVTVMVRPRSLTLNDNATAACDPSSIFELRDRSLT